MKFTAEEFRKANPEKTSQEIYLHNLRYTIGPNRTDLLNWLAVKYDLERYLEIGVQVKALNFDKIKCPVKVGVDPDPAAKATCPCTSDEFFAMRQPIERLDVTSCQDAYQKFKEADNRFDLIFIDGLHTAEQVKTDFENALRFLRPNGFIVLHDCNPLKEEHTIVPRPTPTGHWNGSVYKFAASLLTNGNACTVDIDNGCFVWHNKTGGQYAALNRDITWDYFDKNRKELLNLITWDEFVSIDSHV